MLAPLALEDVGQLIADTLHCAPQRVAPLAQLVHEKTAGNPFFTIQFLYALWPRSICLPSIMVPARWSWDIERIRAKGYTDNVVDLMVGKLAPPARRTRRRPLQLLACLGNVAEIAMLSIVLEISAEQVAGGACGRRCVQELVSGWTELTAFSTTECRKPPIR